MAGPAASGLRGLNRQGCPCRWLGGTFTRIVTAAENIRRRSGKIEEVGTEPDGISAST